MQDIILNPNPIFDTRWRPEWINSAFGRKVITDIQKVDVTDVSFIVEEILSRSGIEVENLDSGIKSLLLIQMFSSFNVSTDTLSDACLKWLLDIADERCCGNYICT